MNAPAPGPIPKPPGNAIKAQRRDARLKAALKANIAKRKAQAQSRSALTQEAENPASDPTE